ncbi:hypothetical protein [Roseateles koreensis]|uniref:Uncharacterized protein n=1 Tax=Roseateles koreensis TaxID=2987526 RepID=A0ABT5KTE5_9BURK|nr:hypothetical protein [Roseateles koreensis]MDC8786091.1 hypothetical protein [Roseateles koreensis]
MLLPVLQACKPGQAPNNPGNLGIPFKQGDKMKVALDVILVSYYTRAIFDVFMNGAWIGDGGVGKKLRSTPLSSYGINAGMTISLGHQTITWRLDGPEGMARNGETVQCENTPRLDSVPPGHQILIVYIYPDDTAELATSDGPVRDSTRGLSILEERNREH